MKNRINLTFFSFGILEQGGGYEDFVINAANDIAKTRKNFNVRIVTANNHMTERLQFWLTIYHLRRHSRNAIYRETALSIQKRLNNVKYEKITSLSAIKVQLMNTDVIVVKNELLELLLLNFLGVDMRKVIIGVHTPVHYPHTPSLSAKLHNLLYGSSIYRRLLRKSSAIEVINTYDLELLKARFGLKNVYLVRSGFNVPPYRENVLIKKETINVLFVGRISEQKGVDVFLGMVDSLKMNENFNHINFRVVGSGEKHLENLLRKYEVKYKNLKFFGHIQSNRMSGQYEWSDIVVIPSRYETLNKIAVEASLHQKLVICSNIPGPSDIILNNVTGFLLPLDPNIFANKIIYLYSLLKDDPTSLNRLRERAYHRVSKNYDKKVNFKTLGKVIENTAITYQK